MQGAARRLLCSDCQTGSPFLQELHTLCWPYVAVTSIRCCHTDTAIMSHNNNVDDNDQNGAYAFWLKMS
jgi:hypothetical protein